MLKKILIIKMALFSCLFIFPGHVPAAAEEVRFFLGERYYIANDKAKSMDVAPLVREGRTCVPVRFVAEALDTLVYWDSHEKKVTLIKPGAERIKLELVVDSNILKVNGVDREIDTAPFIEDGRTYLPARYVAEAFGCEVKWDPDKKCMSISHDWNKADVRQASAEPDQSPAVIKREEITPAEPPRPVREDPKPAFSQSAQPLPASGVVRNYQGSGIAPLEIATKSGSGHFYVKVVHWHSKQPVLTAFVRSGETIRVKVPLGSYEIKYAAGSQWYGEDHLFGPDTVCSKAEKQFDFTVTGNQVRGYRIELYLQYGGNLGTSRINRGDF